MLLLRAFHETVDGEFQTLSATDGRFNREHFFNKYPELAQLTAHLSDDDIDRLRRGGHDPVKIYAAYHAASRHRGQPTVILAKTKKGYGMGRRPRAAMTTHQQKKFDTAALLEFRDRFALPLTDSQVENVEFLRPPPDSAGDEIPPRLPLEARRLPAERATRPPSRSRHRRPTPSAASRSTPRQGDVDDDGLRADAVRAAEGPRPRPARRADHRRRSAHLRHGGPVPADRHLLAGRPALPAEDSTQISFYREATDGQILEEGIDEAGAIASWVAAGTELLDERPADAALLHLLFDVRLPARRRPAVGRGDSRTRGFLLGATAGRTTLAGEGLQHQDGTSHLAASTIPNCRAYDPCYAYELAFIVEDGMRRLLEEQEDAFYYVTVMNENYPQPSAPEGAREAVLRGMHRVRAVDDAKVRLLGAGTILREAIAAAELLEREHGIAADVYSVTSFTELRREAMEVERARRFGMATGGAWVEQQLPANGAPIVAASDYVRAVADLIRPYVADRYVALGTDGFGRSDTRAALRAFFEVDRHAIVGAALHALGRPLSAPATPTPPWRR